jgi:pimeloyl-ACP methyl ester carboxylesterase
VLPGFGAGDGSTLVLRRYLRFLGYSVRGWSLGVNAGDVRALMPRVLERVERLAERVREPVALVGWSLGGVLAREVARESPGLVRRVITLGSPIVGGPKYTAAARFYRLQASTRRARAEIGARGDADRVPSRDLLRADGVAWQASWTDARTPRHRGQRPQQLLGDVC